MIQPWRNALIVKLLGVRHSFNYFTMKLRQKWSMLKGHWTVLDIANDYYIVNFDSEADRNHVLTEGPWIITGRYLAIQKWVPGFQASDDTVSKLTVWIRVSALHVEWFNFQVLTRIGTLLGTTHKVDMRSVSQTRGQYARLCVELDLTKRLETEIKVDDIWYQIQYEGLHLVCFKCGIYGHDLQHCPTTQLNSEVHQQVHTEVTVSSSAMPIQQFTAQKSFVPADTLTFGQWNLVQPRRPRKSLPPTSAQVPSSLKQSGSRYTVLQDVENDDIPAPSDELPSRKAAQDKQKSSQLSSKLPSSTASQRQPRVPRTPASPKSSRSAKGKAIMAQTNGPKIQTNIRPSTNSENLSCMRTGTQSQQTQWETIAGAFPIPKVFSFNVAQELPPAVMESRPIIPLDYSDNRDSLMNEIEPEPPDIQMPELEMNNSIDPLLRTNIEETGSQSHSPVL